jgi:hypothetical protein
MFVYEELYKYARAIICMTAVTQPHKLKQGVMAHPQFVFDCVLFPSPQSDELQSEICYPLTFARECSVCFMGDLLCVLSEFCRSLLAKVKNLKFSDGSGREFQTWWKKTYDVTDRNGKALCILFFESVDSELC